MTTETNITAAASKEQLPTDTSTLQQMVLTLLGQIDDLNGQLYYLKRQLFGKKSEKQKSNDNQRLKKLKSEKMLIIKAENLCQKICPEKQSRSSRQKKKKPAPYAIMKNSV